jgi:AcrR family transcriptional regulator
MIAGGAAQVPDPAAAAPRGTRIRAGNAMGRTRSAVAAGTAQAICLHGARKTTMIDIAASAGIAKGTLYNHVRTRSEAYRLLAEAEVGRLVALLRPSGDVSNILLSAGEFVAMHPVVRALAETEPGALAALSLPTSLTMSGRLAIEDAVERLIGVVATPLVLRWLVSLMFDPGDGASRSGEAAMLAVLADRFGQNVFRAPQAG